MRTESKHARDNRALYKFHLKSPPLSRRPATKPSNAPWESVSLFPPRAYVFEKKNLFLSKHAPRYRRISVRTKFAPRGIFARRDLIYIRFAPPIDVRHAESDDSQEDGVKDRQRESPSDAIESLLRWFFTSDLRVRSVWISINPSCEPLLFHKIGIADAVPFNRRFNRREDEIRNTSWPDIGLISLKLRPKTLALHYVQCRNARNLRV